MNLSGQAVSALLHYLRIPMENLIVIYDDIDLPPGTVRIRKTGSAGTHNGMRSIIGLLGRQDFPRLRVGVGKKPEGWASSPPCLPASAYRPATPCPLDHRRR